MSAPQAAGCTPTSPDPSRATGDCPPITWTSAPAAATSSLRPPRSPGRPYQLLQHHEGQAALDWVAVTRLLDPQPQHRRERAADRPTDASRLAGWVAGLPEGNRNDGLFWAASRALEAGAADLGELADAARHAGLDEPEISRTLASARRRAEIGRACDAQLSAKRTPEPASEQPQPHTPSHDAGQAAPPRADRQLEAEAT